MRIGIDFDNTIVCYDAVFWRVARERGLIGPTVPKRKEAVRDDLRAAGREEDWTRLQGYVYGARMAEAEPFPGVREFFRRCRQLDVPVAIISHKTARPVLGEPYDLHRSAGDWLARHGFLGGDLGLTAESIFWEPTKEAKLARIAAWGCTHFVDDLPEFLAEPAMPPIERLLFDPAGGHGGVRSWADLADRLLGDGVEPLTAELLASAGEAGEFRLARLPGGANNRVYRVDTAAGARLLKVYFHHPADPRDRLGTEWAFLSFAAQQGLTMVPRPLACEAVRHVALYEFVPGRPLAASDVDAGAVDQAVALVAALNARRAEAADLPIASEACFNPGEHLAVVDRRVERLAGVTEPEAAAFIGEQLVPAWQAVRGGVGEPDEPLPEAERCVSPSDFGFHNALLGPDGRLRFIDFEYAGWDDPAKLVCDFLCQPAVPVPEAQHERFLDGVAAALPAARRLRERVARLLPVYRVKWACLLLNEFLPDGGARRGFACPGQDWEARCRAQVSKARKMLEPLAVGQA